MKNKSNNKSQTEAMPYDAMLAAVFRSKREQMRFAKLISIASTYQQDAEWESGVKEMSKQYCIQEAKRLKFPDGWQGEGSYELLKEWFFQACR